MAYTVGKMRIDGSTGKLAIFNVDPSNTADNAPLTAPSSHYGRLHFHSDLDYLEAFYDVSANINFAATSGNATVTHMSATHGNGAVPHAILTVGGRAVQGRTIAQSSGTSYRFLELNIDENNVSVTETRSISFDPDLSAITLAVRILLLRVAPITQATKLLSIDPANGVFLLGKGKFSVAGHPKVRLTNGTPEFRLPALAPSIESSGQTLRIIESDGTVIDLFGYSGSFTAPLGHGAIA